MTVLRATLDAAALAGRARSARGGVADLRRDALGLGLARVAPVLVAAGVDRARVDDDAVDAASALGIRATGDAPTIDSHSLWGLPDAPVVQVWSSVLSVKPLRAGEGVSYGFIHRAAADTRVALVAGGYGQGIVRALGGAVDVEVAGVLRPIVGRVAMDVCVVDIGELAVRAGDRVVYFGGDGPARSALTMWASTTGMRADELIAAIGLHAEWGGGSRAEDGR